MESINTLILSTSSVTCQEGGQFPFVSSIEHTAKITGWLTPCFAAQLYGKLKQKYTIFWATFVTK